MGLSSFNRMRRLQAEALSSTAPVVAPNATKPGKVDAITKQPAPLGPMPTAAEAMALVGGNFMAFKSAAKKVLGDTLPGTKSEIVAALEALVTAGGEPVSETPDGTPTPILEEWEAMTDDEMIALAGELTGGDVVPADGQTQAEKAHSIILATVTDRANPPAKTE